MGEDVDLAIRYRNHAEELRIIADEAIWKGTRTSLLSAAQDYDRMADTLEKMKRMAHDPS